jgi:hypothetical protein
MAGKSFYAQNKVYPDSVFVALLPPNSLSMRSHVYLLLVVVFVVVCTNRGFGQNVTISGYIEDASTGEKLIGAAVFELNSGKGSVTNIYGFYSLTLPQADSAMLRISYTGYTTQIKAIALRSSQSINFDMAEVTELKTVEVLGKMAIEENTQMSSHDLSMEKVKSLPALLGERDVLKTIQLLPGVQGGTEGSSGMYVRGGGPDQNLILLDGVPVYNASHLFGFFSVFNADAINSVTLIKGGFPARYGGRLSSVLDIRMKEGNMKEFGGEGSVGIIASKLTLQGPIVKDKGSFMVSGRRTYIDILARPFLVAMDEGIGGYYFYDFNGKANWKFNDKHRLYFSAYSGDDDFYYRYKDSWVDGGVRYTDRFSSSLGWGNTITALRWNFLINDKLFMNTTATYSRYRFRVGFSQETTMDDGNQKITDKSAYNYFSGIHDWGGKVDFDYIPHPDHYIRFGAGNTYHTFTPGVEQFKLNDGTGGIDTTFGSQQQFAHEWLVYIEDDWRISKRIKANGGVHYSGFLVGGRDYHAIQPRISTRILVDKVSSIKASFATMTQFIHLLTNSSIGLPTDLWVPATNRVLPQQSWQVAAGYARTLQNRMYEVSAEVYYKEMYNLIEYKDGASYFLGSADWQDKIEVGKGDAYGLELMVEKKAGKLTGWIGYTLSWTNRVFENINFGNPFPYRYDRRHDISVVGTYKINDKIDVAAVWVYGSGNAVTMPTQRYFSLYEYMNNVSANWNWNTEIEHIENRNNYRMPAYHRLDLGVNLHKTKKWGEATWSFGVYNAYSRINPFYLEFGRDDNGRRKLYKIGLFPIIPSISYNFKF